MLQMWQLHIYKVGKAMVNLRGQRGCRDIKNRAEPLWFILRFPVCGTAKRLYPRNKYEMSSAHISSI